MQASVGRRLVMPENPPKDPLLMALLSVAVCCLPGVSQIVLGQVAKGVTLVVCCNILAFLTSGLSVLFTWKLVGIDAYLVANQLKNGHPVGEWEFFPS